MFHFVRVSLFWRLSCLCRCATFCFFSSWCRPLSFCFVLIHVFTGSFAEQLWFFGTLVCFFGEPNSRTKAVAVWFFFLARMFLMPLDYLICLCFFLAFSLLDVYSWFRFYFLFFLVVFPVVGVLLIWPVGCLVLVFLFCFSLSLICCYVLISFWPNRFLCAFFTCRGDGAVLYFGFRGFVGRFFVFFFWSSLMYVWFSWWRFFVFNGFSELMP